MIKGLIFDVKRFAIHDGPGIRTTVFLKGCPLACWWCHNPESQVPGVEMLFRDGRCIACGACVEACPRGALSRDAGGPAADPARCTRCGACAAVCYAEARQVVGRETTVDEVMAEVERDSAFYRQSGGGVTFSGGEPLMQIDFLDGLLRASKERSFHTALDTCGYASWRDIDRIRALVDLFLYDLKVIEDECHRELTGVSNGLILENLAELSRRGHAIFLRVAIVPGVNDNDVALREIGAFASRLRNVLELDILPYNRMGIDKYARLDRVYRLPGVREISGERISEIAHFLRGFGLNVKIGG